MKKLFAVQTIILAVSLLLQLSTLCLHLRAAAGDVDLSFDPGSGVNGRVTTVIAQPDGKVLIAGYLTMVKGLLRTNLARLNADGSGDPTFDAGLAGNSVTALARQVDGKLLVAGTFPETYCDEFGCETYYDESVVRLNANGSRDASFIPVTASSFSQSPKFLSLVPLGDGKILVGGEFYSVNGTNRVGIARLNANGTLDASFDTGTGPNGAVSSITLQPDGKIFVNGSFITVNGINRGGLAQLNANGSLNLSFNAGMGTIQFPNCGPGLECFEQTNATAVALQSDGKVLVGLWSRKYFVENEQEHLEDRYWMARLNADGSNDASFVSTNVIAKVGNILIQPDGKLLVCHGFNASQIIRLNANGSSDNSFHSGTDPGGVEAAALQADGKIVIGGTFATVNGTNCHNVARLNSNGTLDLDFNPGQGLERAVSKLVLQPDGKVLVGGPFVWGSRWSGPLGDVLAFANGTNRYGRARLNADGSLDSTPNNFYPQLAGLFRPEDCPGSPYGCDQSAVASFALAQPDGKVLIGGDLETVITGDEVLVFISHVFFARFNADGSHDNTFNPPTNTAATAALVQPDGKIVMGGSVTWNGTNSTVARLNHDGSVDSNFQRGQGPAGVVALALQTDGKVIVAGGNTITRLNSNGTRDLSFGSVSLSNGVAYCLALQTDGKVVIGGSFTNVNGTNRNRVARLNADGTLDTFFDLSTGPDGFVHSIALQQDGNVLIGGDFRVVNGVVRLFVARLFGADVAPSLNIASVSGLLTLSWPVTSLPFKLQETTNLALPNLWSPVAQTAVTNAGRISLSVPTATGSRLFRLKSQ